MKQGKKVIFSTYQSSQKIADALKETDFKFDLIISDEAHRTTGVSSKEFSIVLDDELIPYKNKLFTTATPKILTNSVKSTAGERGLIINSMDDTKVYGPVFHELNFSEAIAKDILTDYKVVVVGVEKEEYKKLITKREIVNYEDIATTDAHTLATLIAVLKGIKKYKLKKIITFHSRVKGAKDFSSLISDIASKLMDSSKFYSKFESDFVSGSMPSFLRDLKLRNLRESKNITLLSNARCLSEGVDVPSLDGVVFADPRRSQVDIVQAIGRAIRKSENKKTGILLLPVVIDEDKKLEDQLYESGFKTVWNVINALKSHDSRIEEQLDNFRLRKGRRKVSSSSSFIDNVEFDLPLKIDKDFEENIRLRILDAVSSSWYEMYGILERYSKKTKTSYIKTKDEFEGYKLGSWVSSQRTSYNKGKLSKDKIELLEKFPDWSWDPDFDYFLDHFEIYKEYCTNHKTNYVVQSTKFKNVDLGKIVASWRYDYKDKKNTRNYKLLNDFGFLWTNEEIKQFRWWKKYEEIKIRYEKNQMKSSDKKWIIDQINEGRKGRKKILLTQEQKSAIHIFKNFDYLPKEKKLEELLNRNLLAIKTYYKINGHINPFINEGIKVNGANINIGKLIHKLRAEKKKGSIKKEYIDAIKLDKNFDWKKSPKSYEYENFTPTLKSFRNLYEFYILNNHKLPVSNELYKNKNMNNTVKNLRSLYKKNKLSKSFIKEIESLNGWKWDATPGSFDKNYELLNKYLKDNKLYELKAGTKYQGKNLNKWIVDNINKYKEGTLNNEKITKFEQIDGWKWETNFSKLEWDAFYDELVIFEQTFNHTNVPKDYKVNNLDLGQWTQRQRASMVSKYKNFDKEKSSKLKKLETWTLNIKDDNWNKKYLILKDWIDKGNTFDDVLPQNYKKLNLKNWVSVQRTSYKENWKSLTPNRREKLEKLKGWTWEARFKDSWTKNFNIVKDIASESEEFPQISDFKKIPSGWIQSQKIKYKDGKLTKKQITALESIKNWYWEDSNFHEWRQKYELFKVYVEKEDTHKILKYQKYRDVHLGYWVYNTRLSYQKRTLTNEKINLMESIPGWEWKI